MKNRSSLQLVIDHFHGIPQLAIALGISRHAIYQWKKIPPARAFQIEVLTQGKFKGHDLLNCTTTQSRED
jgi:biotin operon repressor